MARPVLSIPPMIRLSVRRLVTKKRVRMKEKEMRAEPARATRRHWNFSIRKQTMGERKRGTDWMRPVVTKTEDSDEDLLKNTMNSRVNMPKERDTPSAMK